MSHTSTHLAPAARETQPRNSRGRVIFASLIGTTIEFYDFYIYATASVLVFPKLFFPHATELNAVLSSFAVFGVAFLARPVGAFLFGHYGDRLGRKVTLVASLLIMGVSTFLIGCLPTATNDVLSVVAPTLLVILRFLQGVALGGEWSGAALLATENAPEGKRAIYGTFPQLGAPIGFILANLLFIVMSTQLSAAQFMAWGWRVPFLLSAVMVIVGLYVRLRLVESASFEKVVEAGVVAKLPMSDVFVRHGRAVALGTVAMLATYVLFYLMTSFTLTYGTAPKTEAAAAAAAKSAGKPFNAADFVPGLGFARTEFLWLLIIGVVFFGIFTVLSGPWAERLGRRKLVIGVSVAIAAFGLVWQPLLSMGRPGVIAFLIIGFALMGTTFGPMAAYLPEMFPSNVRYTGSAVAYNLSSVIGAAPASFVAVWLWHVGGNAVLVGLYLALAALITLAAVFFSKDTRDVAFEDNVA
ncbi:MFS transporter [Falsarthrobacter nasiphocae]|uniref:MFS family permease n=1 Tax=Falsarthrobacter nasiphocae TaxID=189863 RepID=A0AAE4C6H4_9MICC|nr:MFS transporter [Falsarthrobacter nasiphocae]MDR6892583.1 MFS family permease [Falsarthrobacter nasiphocae]